MTQKISIALAFLTGLGLIFLGTRFFWSPKIAESAYGLHFNEQGDYSFHHIAGLRDIFAGLLSKPCPISSLSSFALYVE